MVKMTFCKLCLLEKCYKVTYKIAKRYFVWYTIWYNFVLLIFHIYRMKPLSEPEALNRAAAYCTTCERCVSEVCAKLVVWGMDNAQQQRIIDRLIKENFICEERFCRAFVNDKVRFNRWGRRKISLALREKRVDEALAREALEAINEEEYLSALMAVVAAKRRELKGKDDYLSNQKILRYAASRGFETSLIMNVIKFNPDEVDF